MASRCFMPVEKPPTLRRDTVESPTAPSARSAAAEPAADGIRARVANRRRFS